MKVRFLFLVLFSISLYSQEDIRFLSWNIQNFGQSKNAEQIKQIADIIKPYDIVALQEIVAIGDGGEKAVIRLINMLNSNGSEWKYVVSKPTKSSKKHKERYAFLWKSNRVDVIGDGELIKSLQKKVLHEPFVLKIRWNEMFVDLYNFNARNYKENPEKEIASLIDFNVSQNTPSIIMGSFSTFYNNKVYNSLYENSFVSALEGEKTSLKYTCRYNKYLNVATDNIFYDTTYFKYESSGVIDYVGECENLRIAQKISDHLPVVIHLKTCGYSTNPIALK